MNHSPIKGTLRYSIFMGVLTIVFCLIVADGLLGLNYYSEYQFRHYAIWGHLIFWASLFGLPFLFRKKISWPSTLVNLITYAALFPAANWFIQLLGLNRASHFLHSGSNFVSFSGEQFMISLSTSLSLWLIQCLFLLVIDIRTNKQFAEAELISTLFMGSITALLCFAFGDGIFGLETAAGKIIFLLAVVISPLFFKDKTKKAYTFFNIPLNMLLHFLIRFLIGGYNPNSRMMQETDDFFFNGFYVFGVAAAIWLAQSIVLYFVDPRE